MSDIIERWSELHASHVVLNCCPGDSGPMWSIIVVFQAIRRGRFLLGKERKWERKGVVRRNEIKRVTRAPTTDVDPQGRKDQSTGAVARTEARRRERMANRERDEVRRGEEEVEVTCEMCRSGSVGLGVGSGGSLGGLRGVRGYYEEYYCQTQVPDAGGSSTTP